MSSRRADRSRPRSHARPRSGTPARDIALALSVLTVAAGAGVTFLASGDRNGPAERVTANATDTANDTAVDETTDGASPSASPAPGASTSPSPGAGTSAEPGRGASSSASPGRTKRAEAPRKSARKSPEKNTGNNTGNKGTGTEGTAGNGGGERAPGDSGAGTAPDGGGPEAQVLALVNEERKTAGCEPVTANARLTRAADDYSDVMAASGVMSHTGPDGSTMADRVEAAGYAWSNLGENIARGQPDAAAVMDAWMNSPGHRANILNCAFEELGVGVHFGDGGPWWTQNFGTGR
ncbi:CAP domain-containing protein [Streptomyces sp. TRM 70361]|uniref:CAP domain-containing protein n=1 Tax=Streptomyces sp. TRM 70361 TaxID=3116553 RepID=UPI002E7AD92F|nr:CAP domain-containing protein [Streptomyces sp. TRM 70361]MEE1940082.1 CAP domain-containing protein [Streptomyces sp. TRM 70361]